MVKVILVFQRVATTFPKFFYWPYPINFHGGENLFRTTLIAPCGMDCAICIAYLREKTIAVDVMHLTGSAIKTAPYLAATWCGGGTTTIVWSSRVKVYGNSTFDTAKIMA